MLPIMPALCSMPACTYYASILGSGLALDISLAPTHLAGIRESFGEGRASQEGPTGWLSESDQSPCVKEKGNRKKCPLNGCGRGMALKDKKRHQFKTSQ